MDIKNFRQIDNVVTFKFVRGLWKANLKFPGSYIGNLLLDNRFIRQRLNIFRGTNRGKRSRRGKMHRWRQTKYI